MLPYSWVHFIVDSIFGLCGLIKESYAWFRDILKSRK